MTPQEMVHEFHEACDLAIGEVDELPLRRFRMQLVYEETEELCDALEFDEPIEDVAKELADVVYVAYGTAVSLGINLDLAFERVHRSNMSKLVDGKALYNDEGKVMKGPNYEPPNLDDCVGPEW